MDFGPGDSQVNSNGSFSLHRLIPMGASKILIYLTLIAILWGGATPRLALCVPVEGMACCAPAPSACLTDQSCCPCGSQPVRDMTVSAALLPPKLVDLPLTVAVLPRLTALSSPAAPKWALVTGCQSLQPAKLYILHRSLLI